MKQETLSHKISHHQYKTISKLSISKEIKWKHPRSFHEDGDKMPRSHGERSDAWWTAILPCKPNIHMASHQPPP